MRHHVDDKTITCWLEGRITTENVAEVERQVREAAEEAQADCVALDAGELQYISSAGLRAIMRLLKSFHKVRMDNVSPEVYDVLEMTGLTEIMEVWRAPREVSVSGMKQLGAGAFGRVFRMDAERVVKVYEATSYAPERVERERQAARQAFIHGVPCEIPFETVRVGDNLGIVYELVDAHNIGEVVSANPEACEIWARRMAELAIRLHALEFEAGVLPDARRIYSVWVDRIEKSGLIPSSIVESLREFVDAMPAAKTFIHGDFHPANVMVMPDDELSLIDMSDASEGHPALDIAGAYHVMRVVSKRPGGAQRFCGMSPELLGRFWDAFVRAYYDVHDDASVAEIERNLAVVAMPRSLGSSIFTKLIDEEERARISVEFEQRFLAGYNSVRWDLLR